MWPSFAVAFTPRLILEVDANFSLFIDGETVNCQFNWKKREANTWHPDKLTLKVRLSFCWKSFCCLGFCFTYFVVHRARVSYRTVSVTPGTLVGTKAWVRHTKAAMPVFVLSIKYAHIHEIGVILSVTLHACLCHRLIPSFPVEGGKSSLLITEVCRLHATLQSVFCRLHATIQSGFPRAGD